jgi:hypothetical protein
LDLKAELFSFLTKNQDTSLFADLTRLQYLYLLVDITIIYLTSIYFYKEKINLLQACLTLLRHLSVNWCFGKEILISKILHTFRHVIILSLPSINLFFIKKYAEKIINLRIEFEERFFDFKFLEIQFYLFTSIFSMNIDTVPKNMQLEIIEIQCDYN